MNTVRTSPLGALLAALVALGPLAGPAPAHNKHLALRLPAWSQGVLESVQIFHEIDAGPVTDAGWYPIQLPLDARHVTAAAWSPRGLRSEIPVRHFTVRKPSP